MAANRRKQDDKNLEILRQLISLNGNKYCFDCNQRGPTYVNTTIGSFVCSKCSGMLRGLTPPHRVKSISMATFTSEEIDFVKSRGNDFCKRVWLGIYSGESENLTDEQSVKDFMSDKYEKKRYYLEPSQNPASITNGNVTSKNKLKSKSGTVSSTTATLISISPQSSKPTVNNNNNSSNLNSEMVNNLFPAMTDSSQKVSRPVHSTPQNFLTSTITVAPTAKVQTQPVPDFPVDFSNANIYNSNQLSNGFTNNNYSLSQNSPQMNTNNATIDRYAALADLDMALRQQNMKPIDTFETRDVPIKNPFQSSTTSDVFSNKNPFFNGGWNTSAQVPVNPFMPSTNNGNFLNSNNPFL